MTDQYLLLAVVRMEELRREAGIARRGRSPRDVGQSVSRPRIVLARWLMAAAQWLWPQASREVMGGAR
jgi:hypothetical protein